PRIPLHHATFTACSCYRLPPHGAGVRPAPTGGELPCTLFEKTKLAWRPLVGEHADVRRPARVCLSYRGLRQATVAIRDGMPAARSPLALSAVGGVYDP